MKQYEHHNAKIVDGLHDTFTTRTIKKASFQEEKSGTRKYSYGCLTIFWRNKNLKNKTKINSLVIFI